MASTTDPTRLAMLARIERGELDHSAAAKELGLTPGVWGLWRARHAKASGGGKPSATKRAKASGRGRKADVAETARRVAMLKRVQAGELNNAAAAKTLGISDAAWAAWKSYYLKRAGGRKPARPVRPPGSARLGRPPGRTAGRPAASGGLSRLIVQLETLQRFGEELRERVREIVEMVEGRFPG